MLYKNYYKIIVYFLIFCLLAIPVKAEEINKDASLFLSVDKASYFDPDYLYIDLMLDSATNAINAVDISLLFASSSLSLATTSLENSFCEFIVKEEMNNNKGNYNLTCGNTSTIASNTPLARLTFNKLKTGFTKLNISENSAVLANDGYGTNILGNREIHNVFVN